jgi:hypothetical protein
MDSRSFSQRNSSSLSVASRQSSADSAASATSKTSRRSRLLKLLPARKRRASASDGQARQQDAAVDPQQLGLVSSNSDSNSLVLLDDRETERYVSEPWRIAFAWARLRHRGQDQTDLAAMSMLR